MKTLNHRDREEFRDAFYEMCCRIAKYPLDEFNDDMFISVGDYDCPTPTVQVYVDGESYELRAVVWFSESGGVRPALNFTVPNDKEKDT